MRKTIKTIWNGQIGIHEKYLNFITREPIEFVYNGAQTQFYGDKMTINKSDIRRASMGKETYQEKQGYGRYKLAYFDWISDKGNQDKLF